MQINRLFEIVYLLIDKKRMTANELAAHFEVSKRTILRDIDTLGTVGIPIYTTQGKGGGIFIHDSFVLNKTLISTEEQKKISFALQSMSATGHIDTKQTLGRLQSFFASSAKEWVEVDFSRWGHSAADNAKFALLKDAIINELTLSFDYLSPQTQQKGRKVYPLKLAFKSKAWYLQSFCLNEQDYRVFKFNRMSNIDVLSETFDSSSYDSPPMKSVEEPRPAQHIRLRVSVLPNAKYRIYDEFLGEDITVNDDGTFTLTIPLAPWIYDYILSYGTAITILEPHHVRDTLIAHIENIKSNYLPKT